MKLFLITKFAFWVLVSILSGRGNSACIDDVVTILGDGLFWKNYKREYFQRMDFYMKPFRDVYYSAYQAGDENLSFLYQIGFKFEEDAVIVPHPNFIIQGIKSEYQEVISNGAISESDILIPGLPVQNQRGQIGVIPFGTVLPSGATPLDDITLEFETIIRIINAGFYPFGRYDALADGVTPMIVHDLGHFGSFIQNPEYLKFVRALAQKLKGNLDSVSELVERRVNFLMETLVWIKPEKDEFIKSLLERFIKEGRGSVKVSDYENQLKKLTDDDLLKLRDELVESSSDYLSLLGGAMRDVALRSTRAGDDRFHHFLNIKTLIENLNTGSENSKALLINRIARHFTILHYMRKVSFEDILDAFDKTPIPSSSPVYDLFCASGAFINNHLNPTWCN